MSVNQPHLRYRHMYLVVRLDPYLDLANAWTCVSAWYTESLAYAEAERLNRINQDDPPRYSVQMTRLKEVRLENIKPIDPESRNRTLSYGK